MIRAPESPEMLAGRAREYIRSFGYNEPPKDTAMGWEYNQQFLAQLWKEKSVADRPGVLQTLQPPAIAFWYRQHPWGLYSMAAPAVTRTDPWFRPSSIEVVLDPLGRLVEFHAAPPERKPYEPGSPPDWNKLFAAAGLDLAKFQTAQPQFAPRTAYDLRQAWKGVYPTSPATEVHVEAAAYEGRVSSFRVVAPSSYQAFGLPPDPFVRTFVLVFMVILPLWAVVMAWRNASRGRADWNGALRLGLFGFAVTIVRGLLVSHHMAAMEGLVLWKVIREGSTSLFLAAVLYLAFEPYVRRRMPRSLVSWSRILEGRWRDAHVGSDILIGLAAYAASAAGGLALALAGQLPRWQPGLAVSGSAWSAAALYALLFSAVGLGLSYLLMLAVLRFLLRRTWLAAAVLAVVLSLAYGGAPTGMGFWEIAVVVSPFCFLLPRFGLVAATTLLLVYELLRATPLTTDFSRWYAWQGICAVLVLLALGAYAFWTNLGGRPLWQEED
jgi:hypothetical protein